MRKKAVSRTFRVMFGVVVVLLGFAQGLASALAADGDLDAGFGIGGKVTTDSKRWTSTTTAVACSPLRSATTPRSTARAIY